MNKLSTRQIQDIAQKWLFEKGNIYQALNFSKCYFREADVLGITKSGIVTEIEVKISRADFKQDFNKVFKHEEMANGTCKPNKFYYISGGLIMKKEVPDYAGILEIDRFGEIEIIRQAPMLHKNKCEDNVLIAIAKHLTAYQLLGCQPMTFKNRGY